METENKREESREKGRKEKGIRCEREKGRKVER